MNISINNISVNPFCLRQVAASPFSHSSRSFDEVANLLRDVSPTNISEGYQPATHDQGGRVILARLTPEQMGSDFFSAITLIEDGEEVLEGMRSRREGEEPRPFREVVRDEKPVASTVDLVFYNSIALAQDGDNVSDLDPGNWELVSINASQDSNMEAPPITPNALYANFHHLSGGTETNMTEDEYNTQMAKSKAYWDIRANIRLRGSL
tara:strand:- start:364 stop:990 length:627 start_codon:yes stop_codon:yes gene_type:complete